MADSPALIDARADLRLKLMQAGEMAGREFDEYAWYEASAHAQRIQRAADLMHALEIAAANKPTEAI